MIGMKAQTRDEELRLMWKTVSASLVVRINGGQTFRSTPEDGLQPTEPHRDQLGRAES